MDIKERREREGGVTDVVGGLSPGEKERRAGGRDRVREGSSLLVQAHSTSARTQY